MHSQNKTYQMEQFVVRKGFEAKTLKDLKGAKLMSAPGPANLNTAKAVLAKVGLKDGDYTHRPARHGPARQRHDGRARSTPAIRSSRTPPPCARWASPPRIEAGVIANYILGDPSANAYVGGCALTTDFIKSRPGRRQALCRRLGARPLD